jgi:asparagine N-glycosylation enzyme membrane subunit Stt3
MRVFLSSSFDRWQDSGFNASVKKDLEDPDDDQVNTQCEDQEALEELYQGDQFEGDLAISRLGSTTVICLMFGAGMPVMYLNGILFFVLTFYIGKLLLFQYYQKSTDLDRFLPLTVVPVIKLSVSFHMLLGLVVFFTGDIVPVRAASEPRWNPSWLDWVGALLPGIDFSGFHFYQKVYVTFIAAYVVYELGQRFGFAMLGFVFAQIIGCLAFAWRQIKSLFTALYKCLCCIESTKAHNKTEDQEL